MTLHSKGILASVLLMGSVQSVWCSWHQVHMELPDIRSRHAMVSNSTTGEILLYGGLNGSGISTVNGDLWKFDGIKWLKIANEQLGMGVRSDHALSYDPVRDRIVLFGGTIGSYPLPTDTWEWTGSSWQQFSGPGPSGRNLPAMCFDGVNGKTMLFGGQTVGNGFPSETWEWDGVQWTQLQVSGPAGRFEHKMVYDESRHVVVLFGGKLIISQHDTILTDTWEWDGAAWHLRSQVGPVPIRSHFAMAYDRKSHRVVLSGGSQGNNPYYNDTWAWDGSSWSLIGSQFSPGRDRSAMAYCGLSGKSILFGGYWWIDNDHHGELRDTWELGDNQWHLHETDPPGGRLYHSIVYAEHLGVSNLVGGYNGSTGIGDTWTWNGNIWSRLASAISPRSLHACAYDSNRHVTVLFGGYQEPNFKGDTLEWDGNSWTTRQVSGPSPRMGHSMAFDRKRGRTVLFGGFNGSYLSDTWEYDGTSWQRMKTIGPSARCYHTMAFDELTGKVVLFGGFNGFDLGDTWEWDGQHWMRVSVTGPEARMGSAMTYNPNLRAMQLFGGNSYGTLHGDTWTWDGASWQLIASSGPTPRAFHSMTFDRARKKVVLYSGFDGGIVDDVWEW